MLLVRTQETGCLLGFCTRDSYTMNLYYTTAGSNSECEGQRGTWGEARQATECMFQGYERRVQRGQLWEQGHSDRPDKVMESQPSVLLDQSGQQVSDRAEYCTASYVHVPAAYPYGSWWGTRHPMISTSAISHMSPVLYRVYDDSSVSKHRWFGFVSGLPYMPGTSVEFRNLLERHVDWRCRLTTPFISMTDSPHVVDWQVSIRTQVKRRNIMIAVIDTAVLLHHCGSSLWEMRNLMEHYGISPPRKLTLETFNNEYICALLVPSVAIVRLCTPFDFRVRTLDYLRVNYLGSSIGTNNSSQGVFGNAVPHVM